MKPSAEMLEAFLCATGPPTPKGGGRSGYVGYGIGFVIHCQVVEQRLCSAFVDLNTTILFVGVLLME